MTYNILLIKDNNNNIIENARCLLEEVGRKFSKDFTFDTCDISASNDEIIKKAKSAHSVLLCGKTPALRGICKELGLYASVRRIGEYTVVNDAFGGIYDGDKGFRNNPTFGREAYDVESYSELEIERVARVAYELDSTRHITLIDKANELATSKLWRKIVTDINEDYPFVNVDMDSVESAVSALTKTTAPDTLLTSHLFGDIIYCVLSAKYATAYESSFAKTQQSKINEIANENTFVATRQNKSNEVAAMLGDTTLGMYVLHGSIVADVASALAFMLRHSFDMQAEADYLESKGI